MQEQTLEVVTETKAAPGQTLAHVEFTRDGRCALASRWEMDGALVVIDARTLQEAKRIPAKKPVGKDNVWNRIPRSEGTSHRAGRNRYAPGLPRQAWPRCTAARRGVSCCAGNTINVWRVGAMRRISKGLLHHLVVVSLCCSCAVALAVPKAAEHEDEAVTFGEAGSPPKPTAKHAAPPVAKAASGTAETADKPARHAKTKESRRSAGKAGSVSKGHQGSKPATATKQQQPSAKPKAASSAKTPKTTPVKKAPEKARSSGTARKK